MTDTYRVTGLMSGSSMDGVDLAFCEFSMTHGVWQFQIIAAETFPYPAPLSTELQYAINWKRAQIGELDLKMGRYFALLINGFHEKYHLLPGLISSHGHTILHQPGRGITLQVGNGAELARLTGIPVVCDFRSEDVAQGGQGAPLVPVGDRLLFGEYGACLNLGGFGNISYERPDGKREAFDICPVNMALNWVANQMGHSYDPDGDIGRSGSVDDDLLEELNALAYYSEPAPKSLGREWFNRHFLPHLHRRNMEKRDLLATLVEHIALQTEQAFGPSGAGKILITGGGAFNRFLIERLESKAGAILVIPDQILVKYKEALIFALLGLLRTRGEINCLSSVTGGKNDLSTGTIYSPQFHHP